MNNGETILSLLKELEEMPEHQTLEKIRHFSISIEIFNGNYAELIHHIRTHNNPKETLELIGVNKRHVLHAYQKEITRFLHNYIASALSLTDHARNHYRELYSKSDLFPEYQVEIDIRFVNNSMAVFIKDLRQYIQHYRMPGVSTRLNYTKDAPDFVIKLLLKKKELMKFSNWSSLSKKYLIEQTDDIDLFTLINDYHQLIESFYLWFIDKQMQIHKNDLKRVNEHKIKIRDLEVNQLLNYLIGQVKTVYEFENELFKYFNNEDLVQIRNAVTMAEKGKGIVNLLKQIKNIDQETEDKLLTIYNPGMTL